MDITPLNTKGRHIIERYGNGGFVVSEVAYRGNILILPQQVLAWQVKDIATLDADAFAPLLAQDVLPEILLVGAGNSFAPLPAALRDVLRPRRIMVDMMDTGAACRTYNILINEDRRVAAALMAVP